MCQKPATMWKTTPVQPHFAALLGLVFLVLWCCSTSVEAHGQLQVPPSRNHLINNVWTAPPGIAYNQNSGNGRGFETGSVAQQPGVCGDPWQTITDRAYYNYVFSMPWGEAARMQNPTSPNIPTYSAGQRVTFQWLITASHTGYFALKLCPLKGLTNAADLQACFDKYPLQRADGQGRQWWELATAAGTLTSADYLLPSDVTCPEGCMIQWEYVTANSCWTRGFCENPRVCGQFAASSPTSQWCSDTIKPERFYNCADIKITAGAPPPPCSNCATPQGVCQTGGGCNTATGQCDPLANAPDGTVCSGGTCKSGLCTATPVCSNCGTPGVCQTGGGCNTATGQCKPLANAPDGTVCSGGTCKSGMCTAMPVCSNCPTTGVCRVGGGCNTATGQCNPLSIAPDGTVCSGGTCKSGVCSTRCQSTAAPGGTCGGAAGVCCPSGQCCSQWGWCGTTVGHCGAGCQPQFSAAGTTCNSIRVQSNSWLRRVARSNATALAASSSVVVVPSVDAALATNPSSTDAIMADAVAVASSATPDSVSVATPVAGAALAASSADVAAPSADTALATNRSSEAVTETVAAASSTSPVTTAPSVDAEQQLPAASDPVAVAPAAAATPGGVATESDAVVLPSVAPVVDGSAFAQVADP